MSDIDKDDTVKALKGMAPCPICSVKRVCMSMLHINHITFGELCCNQCETSNYHCPECDNTKWIPEERLEAATNMGRALDYRHNTYI